MKSLVDPLRLCLPFVRSVASTSQVGEVGDSERLEREGSGSSHIYGPTPAALTCHFFDGKTRRQLDVRLLLAYEQNATARRTSKTDTKNLPHDRIGSAPVRRPV